jgi:hypothetical protein
MLIGAGLLAGFLLTRQGVQQDNAIPTISECGTKPPVERPRIIVVTCADFGEQVKAIKWISWGATMATGIATVSANDCTPDCADGHFHPYSAEVVLDRVQVNQFGPQFTRMILLYERGPPATEPSRSTMTWRCIRPDSRQLSVQARRTPTAVPAHTQNSSCHDAGLRPVP